MPARARSCSGQGLNKAKGTGIIISQNTVDRLPNTSWDEALDIYSGS